MASKALLFDVNNTLVRENKNIGQYYTENIRNVYGIYIDDIDLSKYDGTVQDVLYSILEKEGLSTEDVDSKLELFFNELPYAYYNVAGLLGATPMEGAKDTLSRFLKDNEFAIGLATPILEKIAASMFERAKIDRTLFRFAQYGSHDKDAETIVLRAAQQAEMLGANIDKVAFVSASPKMISAAKATEVRAIWLSGSATDNVLADATINNLKELGGVVKRLI